MGSEDSKKYSQNNNTDINFNISYTSSDFNRINTINSEESISKTKPDMKNSSKENEDKIIEKNNNNKYPVTFEWTGGGNSIYVSGNFCNWNQLFLMQKESEGKYILKLDVNKGLIQYKFKVDNEWKINKNFPSLIDNGNLNNYIDTSKIIISSNKSELTTDENTESSNKNLENINFENNSRFNNRKNYGNIFPKFNEMSNAKIAPENFLKKIKNYRNVEIVKINHFNFCDNNNAVSVVCRYRLKCTNFVYYKNG